LSILKEFAPLVSPPAFFFPYRPTDNFFYIFMLFLGSFLQGGDEVVESSLALGSNMTALTLFAALSVSAARDLKPYCLAGHNYFIPKFYF
jgi:hypothetical protein